MNIMLCIADYIELASTIFYDCLRPGEQNSNCTAFVLLFRNMQS